MSFKVTDYTIFLRGIYLVQDLDEVRHGDPRRVVRRDRDVLLAEGDLRERGERDRQRRALEGGPEPRAAGRVGLVLLPPAWKSNGEHGFVDGVRVQSLISTQPSTARSAGPSPRAAGCTPRPCRGRRGSHRRIASRGRRRGAAASVSSRRGRTPRLRSRRPRTQGRAASLFALCRCRDYGCSGGVHWQSSTRGSPM